VRQKSLCTRTVVRPAIPHLQQAIAIDPEFAMAAWPTSGSCRGKDGPNRSGSRRKSAIGVQVSGIASAIGRGANILMTLRPARSPGTYRKELQTLESWAQTYPARCLMPRHYRGLGRIWAPANMKGDSSISRGAYGSIRASELHTEVLPSTIFTSTGITQHTDALQRARRSANWKPRNL